MATSLSDALHSLDQALSAPSATRGWFVPLDDISRIDAAIQEASQRLVQTPSQLSRLLPSLRQLQRHRRGCVRGLVDAIAVIDQALPRARQTGRWPRAGLLRTLAWAQHAAGNEQAHAAALGELRHCAGQDPFLSRLVAEASRGYQRNGEVYLAICDLRPQSPGLAQERKHTSREGKWACCTASRGAAACAGAAQRWRPAPWCATPWQLWTGLYSLLETEEGLGL